MNKDIRIEIYTYGSIFSRFLEVENEVVNLDYDSTKNVHFKALPDYEITGNLDIYLKCRGKNGAYCTLKVFIDQEKKPRISEKLVMKGGGAAKSISQKIL